MSYEDWLDDHLLRMHDRIRRLAYTTTGVLGDGIEPPWVYSTGLLDTFAHPELIVVGLPIEDGYERLVAWAELIRGCVRPTVAAPSTTRAVFPTTPAIRSPANSRCSITSLMGVTHVLPRGVPLTYEDLQAMPEDGHRYELVDGVLIVTPSPRALHQRAVGRLFRLLSDAAPADVEALVGPFDFKVSDLTVLVPDIVVARRDDYEEQYIRRTPLLVIEVQSPSTARIDRGTKRLAFEGAGVPSYWLFDPDEPSLTVLELVDGAYQDVVYVVADEPFVATRPFHVRVVPLDLVR